MNGGSSNSANGGAGIVTSDLPMENYGHPFAAMFHVSFKILAVVWYVLANIIGAGFITDFVVLVCLLSADFWVVKNVSGRLLVGLRWWNDVDGNGDSRWTFESVDVHAQQQLNKKDSSIFWTALYLFPAIWIGLGILAFLKFNFDYLLIVIIAVILSGR